MHFPWQTVDNGRRTCETQDHCIFVMSFSPGFLGLITASNIGEEKDLAMIIQQPVAALQVLEEFRKGFKYKDELLRPAMVKVAVSSAPPAPPVEIVDEGKADDKPETKPE